MSDALGTRVKLLRKQGLKTMAHAHGTTSYGKKRKKTTKPHVKGTNNTRHNHGLI